MRPITGWLDFDGYSIRTIVGENPDNVAARVAIIQKTGKVRIRDDYHGYANYYNIKGEPTEADRQWEAWLDWAEGPKGSGPTDEDTRKWCDNMLTALGYTVV